MIMSQGPNSQNPASADGVTEDTSVHANAAQFAGHEVRAHAVPAANQLRKSRTRWRVAAFFALVIAVLALIGRFGWPAQNSSDAYIARLELVGVIATDPFRLDVINQLAADEQVKAVIVSINSPGGTTAGGEELYEAIGKLREAKPVVGVIHEVGASAAYMTAIATDRIFARRLSIVGSIGVLMQHMNFGRLLEAIGVDFDKIQTGPLKAEPDFDEPLDGPARESLQALVNDSFEWFVDIVAERRELDRPKALEQADGRILTGRMALESKLIDEIGSEAEAITWLESSRDIEVDLSVRTIFPLPEGELERLARYLGSQARSIVGIAPDSAIALDGLVSLWQAAPTK